MSIRVQTMLRRAALLGLTAIVVSTGSQFAGAAAQAAPVSHRASPPSVAAAPAKGQTATITAVTARAVQARAQAQVAYAAQARSYRIVAAARAQRGKPYRFGARGPGAFDCSGLTGYAYRTVRIALPRTANQQYHRARHISYAAARPGDLVFWVTGSHAYHVAVYAGGGQVWHAPRPGRRVQISRIWSWGEVHFGRIGA